MVAEPAAAEGVDTEAAYTALRQVAFLPIMWQANKVDFTNQENRQILLVAFCTVVALGWLAIQLAVVRIKRKNDSGRVLNPGSTVQVDEQKAADGSVSVCSYDKAFLQQAKMQFMMIAAVGTFLHLQWGYTQPLLLMCIMQPLQLWDNKALAVHLRGRSGPGYERPWKATHAGNPLAQWAEKKRAEAEEAAKKAD